MSEIALTARAAYPSRLQAIRDWLRQAHVAARLEPAELRGLPDHLLRDIGVEGGVARTADRGLAPRVDAPTRLGLLDLGWQPPRPPRRR